MSSVALLAYRRQRRDKMLHRMGSTWKCGDHIQWMYLVTKECKARLNLKRAGLLTACALAQQLLWRFGRNDPGCQEQQGSETTAKRRGQG
jgi:hypothetical protein